MLPDSVGREVWRELDRQRRVLAVALGQLGLFGLERGEQRTERGVFLQLAQARGVRRGDVDADVACVGVHRAQAGQVVVDGALVGCVEVPADVKAEYAPALRPEAGARDVGEKALDAIVVEAEAVNEGFGLRQPEQAWRRIARLRSRRHGAAFDEAEAQAGQAVDVARILVQSRGETDTIGEAKPHRLDRRRRRARSDALRDPERCRGIEAGQCGIVRDLRIEREEQRTEERVEHAQGRGLEGGGPAGRLRAGNDFDNAREPGPTLKAGG